ncbi:MAG: hypothetical protein M3Y48_06675 [Actinomycetota bacterium]|nr:hypothetical protein [Actinomycetota bacterium]
MHVVSGAVDGWSEWDRRFCVLCVADHGGDWEGLSERLFDPSAYRQSGSASNGEAFWSHVLDLRRRLDEAGLDAVAVAGERVIAKSVAAESRRKVFKRALTNNEPSLPMIQTPRVRLAQRAATGNWDGFPVSPQPFHDRLVRSSGIDRWTFGEGATMMLADDFQAGVAVAERDAGGDPAVVLAVRRAALTVAVFAQEAGDDSSGYLGAVGQEMILAYARTDWPVTGIVASMYWQDLLEYLLWEDYALTHGVERDILAAAGASTARGTCVVILEGLAREWAQARAAYTAGRAGFWLDMVRHM